MRMRVEVISPGRAVKEWRKGFYQIGRNCKTRSTMT
jgi:hypothetical protein